jgi:glucose/mannose-6-phosphate isomerase
MVDYQDLKQRLDSHDMFGMISALPNHLKEGLAIGLNVNLQNLEMETFHSVIVAGMGGSAIAGDLVRSYLYNAIQIPFIICRHYCLPGYANKKALVICSSYSGDTEETLSAYDNALDKGAKVVAITTGGKLARKAEHDGIPLLRIKGGLPPRAALGYSFASLLTIISRLGLCSDQCDEIEHTINSLNRWMSLYQPENTDNPAIKLAEKIHGSIPVIYSGYERLDAVATRFKGQLSENAKTLAFTNVFPELSHNELVGWQVSNASDRQFMVIILKDAQEHKRLKLRMEIVTQYLREKNTEVSILECRAGIDLERMFYFIQYLDFASYYLAMLNGVDPYPIAAIDYLKDKLSKMN